MSSSPPPSPGPPLEVWSPPVRLPFYARLLRGWSLVALILGVLVLYGVFRGRQDYYSFKVWLARKDAVEALKLGEAGDDAGAIKLLEKAGIRTLMNDPTVLRAFVEFNEPRKDPVAIYSLRKLVNMGQATHDERVKLCVLAYDWKQPEYADTDLLREWALTDTAQLELRPLELSARWMATRGQGDEAERRLKEALRKADGTDTQPKIAVVLTRLLLESPAAKEGQKVVISECLDYLQLAMNHTQPPDATHGESAKLIAAIALDAKGHEHVPGALTGLTQSELLAQANALPEKLEVSALGYRLDELALRMMLEGLGKSELAQEFADKYVTASEPVRAALARWMVSNGHSDIALKMCDAKPEQLSKKDWFVLRLDALHQLQRWPEIHKALAGNTPLPELVKALFTLSISKSDASAIGIVEGNRKSLHGLITRAEPKDSLYVAGVLEHVGEVRLAMDLYDSLQNHSQAGLPSRLGMVRCLSTQLERTPELIGALNSLLVLWPRSDEARSDLSYLRLLDNTHRPEDLQSAIHLAQTNPWYLAYRIPAALAFLRINENKNALRLLGEGVPWDKTRPGWRAVYAATLAANQQLEEAKRMAGTLPADSLRPGEIKLLEQYSLSPKL